MHTGRPPARPPARRYGIVATYHTAAHLRANGVPCQSVLKIQEGRPNAGA